MTTKWLERIAATGAFLSIVLMIAGYEFIGVSIVNDPPTFGEWAGGYVSMLGEVTFIFFVGYLASVLRRAEGDGGWFWLVALGGGLLKSAVAMDSYPPAFAALFREKQGLDTQVAAVLNEMNDISFALMLLAMGIMLLGTAAVVIRTAGLPRWFGWVSLIVGVALIANVTTFTQGFLPVILLYYVWTIVGAVVLIRQVGRVSSIAHNTPVGLSSGA